MPDSVNIAGPELVRTFPGDSEMAHRMRAFDWSNTELGSPENWPENLRVVVRLCLTSRFPVLIWWGARLALLYNDACIPWLDQAKHPLALMRPGRECWSEVWDTIGPMLESVVATGQSTWSENLELFVDRKPHKDEISATFTFAPILSADGQLVEGVFAPCFEVTCRVLSARRLETLRKLGIRAGVRTVEAACKEAAAVLSENPRDIPFAAIYMVNATGKEARLTAVTLPADEHRLPLSVSVSDGDSLTPWPLASVLRTKRSEEIAGLDARGVCLRGGLWPEWTREGIVFPIFAAEDGLSGLLLVGVSPRRPFDAAYRAFFESVAAHVATAISNAQAYEAERERADALAERNRERTAFFRSAERYFKAQVDLARMTRATTLGEFAVSIAHELNQPLGAIVNNSAICLRLATAVPGLSEDVCETLTDIVTDARRASSIVSRVRTLTQFRAERFPVQIKELITGVLVLAQRELSERGITVRVELPEELPRVSASRVQLQQVLLDLVMNGIEAMSGVADELRLLTIRGQRDEWDGQPVVLITVQDFGVGFRQEDADRLFEAFYTTKPHGMGLSLCTSRSIVEAHGGRLWATSNDGQGATLSCVLPVDNSLDRTAGDTD